jgi:hypothetical protein
VERTEILRTIWEHFDEFKKAWTDEEEENGPGALVFRSEYPSDPREEEIKCEFWTMAELRAALRTLEEPDELIYKWLRSVQVNDEFAIVIISPDKKISKAEMHFHIVARETTQRP